MVIVFAGAEVLLDVGGALYYPTERLLVVADLHIEKGRSIGLRLRRPLPPYDTRETLRRLSAAIALYEPRTIACLGDSFHDANALLSLEPTDRDAINLLAVGKRWIWIVGNHDPFVPSGMGGEVVDQLTIGSLVFRHDYDGGTGVVIGHFHPVAATLLGGRLLRRRCFVATNQLLIMPAFGSYTGGLNIRHPVLAGLVGTEPDVFMLGSRGVHRIHWSRLMSDGGRSDISLEAKKTKAS